MRTRSIASFVSIAVSILALGALGAACNSSDDSSDSNGSPVGVGGAKGGSDAGVPDAKADQSATGGAGDGAGGTAGAGGAAGAGGTAGSGDTDAGPEAAGPDAEAGVNCLATTACTTCISAKCPATDYPEYTLPACTGATGNAASGPAAGVSKLDLCKAVWDCIGTTNCAASGYDTDCYCGTATSDGCLAAGAANGACKSAIQDGLETTDPSVITTVSWTDTDLGGGRALFLFACASKFCSSQCVTCSAPDAGH